MPSSMTHTYFGKDVYNSLNNECKNLIKNDLEYFKLFCQGADPFMFYHFMVGRKAQKVRDIQALMHKNKTQDFFISTVKYIHDNKLGNNGKAMAYLFGYMCHYYLDMYVHPFIYYKGGIYKRKDKTTYKYNGVHQKIEYAIDLYLIEKREKVKAKDFKVYKAIFDVNGLDDDLKGLIDYSIGKVYDIDNISFYYEKSIRDMKSFFRYVNQDKYGIKGQFYKLFDYIMHDKFIKIEELSFNKRYDKEIDNYLNINKKEWCCPFDDKVKYNSSFFDLYDKALKNSVNSIQVVAEMLKKDKLDEKELKKIFRNLSFVTGIDCKRKVSLKYFEF